MIALSQDRDMHEIVVRAILRTGNRQGTQYMDLDMHARLQYCNTTGIRLRAMVYIYIYGRSAATPLILRPGTAGPVSPQHCEYCEYRGF